MHTPVLLNEVCEYLSSAQRIIDATISGGGHAFALLEKNPDLKVLGIEWDAKLAESLKREAQNLKLEDRLQIVNDSYVNIQKVAQEHHFKPDGILFDLGLSSWHYEESGRGFSFKKDELLDMRFSTTEKKERNSTEIPIGNGLRPANGTNSETAADIVNMTPPQELERILREYGEEQFAKQITDSIIRYRRSKPIVTTNDLVAVIETAVPEWYRHKKIHCATKTFQALRIAVNHELENVTIGIQAALDVLEPQGRLLVIAFHGLEDKIVKEFFKQQAKAGTIRLIEKKAVQATWEERKRNPRSRSAKMRVVEKI